MGFNYVPKVGNIYVKTLTPVNAWVQVLTADQTRGIRGFKIKSRYTFGQTTQRPFDYAFSSNPANGDTATGNGFWSNSGAGSGDEASPSSGVFARTAVAGTILEIITYN